MPVARLQVDDPRWRAFVADHREATVFHHPAWAALLADCYGYRPLLLAVLDATGQVVAGLPLMGVRSWLTGRRVVGMPFSDFCPPLAVDDRALGELTEGLLEHQRQRHWPAVQVHWPLPARPGVHPTEVVARHVTRLASDPEQVRRRFRSSVGRLIRQAERAEIAVARGDGWDDVRAFYCLHQETRRRLGTPVQPLRFFRLLWERVLSQGLGFVLLAHKDGQPVAGAVFLHWNGTLIYKYGASLPAYWQLRPNNLLFWEGIRWGCEHDYQIFDWGKTDLEDEGLRNFKRGWGSEESLVAYSVLADARPAPVAAGSSRRVLTSLIQRSPLWVGRAVGEALYGHFA